MYPDSLWAAGNAQTNYQWLDCNDNYALISGASNQSFVPAFDGSYAVQFNENNCIDTSACYQFLWLHESQIVHENNWRIYPNPTQQMLYVEQQLKQYVQVELVDNLGRIIDQKYTNQQLIALEMRNLPAGVYHLRLGQGTSWTHKKIIKIE